MRRRISLVLGCLVAGFSAWATAQQPPPGQAPVFKAAVDLVHLDVSVLDKNRAPVRGLTAADFTVIEDGRPQSIVAFSAVDVPDPEPPPAPWVNRVSPDVQSNAGIESPEGRLFVLLMDDAMMPPYQPSLETARRIARKFVDRVTTADRVAVVFSANGRRNQNFTNDHAKLLAAIDSFQQGYATHLLGWETAKDARTPIILPKPAEIPGPMGDPDIVYRAASMSTLRSVAETLISAPERRKALIFVSPGIEVDNLASSAPVKGDQEVDLSKRDANRELQRSMPELFLRMQRANVTIYPVDPCGQGGFEAYVLNAAAALKSLMVNDNHEVMNGEISLIPASMLPNPNINPTAYDWLNTGNFVPRPDDLAKHMSSLSMDFLNTTAANTGGLAIVNTNDFDTGIDRIFRENSSYYVIGYQQPPGSSAPGSIHQLSVRVTRPDVTVRTRSGYYTPEAPKPGKSGTVVPISPLDKAIAAAVPSGAFPMRVAFAAFAVPGKKDPIVTMVLGLEQPGVTKRTTYAVDLQLNAYTTDGRPKLVGRRHTASVVLVPTAGKSTARYDLLSDVSLPPGHYELRLSAHRALDDVTGSLFADVEVPDFTKAALSASGVMVETLPADATAPPGAFDALVPAVPTSNREFSQKQEASAYLRIYQGGKDPLVPVKVTARITDHKDAVIGEGTETLDSGQFHIGGRAADYRFPIPVERLPPGPYLLTLEIAGGKATVARHVQFTVVK